MCVGAAEGESLMKGTVAKHSNIMESIRDLQHKIHSEIQRLQVKGQEERTEAEEWRGCSDNKGEEKERRENTSDWVRVVQHLALPPSCDQVIQQHGVLQVQPKESGHTPELTREHDGKEMPINWQKAANRKALSEWRSHGEDEEGKALDRRCVKASV